MRSERVRGVCIGVAVSGVLAVGQTAQFEVASVKPASPDARRIRCTGGPGTSDPGSLRCENYSLSFLVMMAYNPAASNWPRPPGWTPPGTTSWRRFRPAPTGGSSE